MEFDDGDVGLRVQPERMSHACYVTTKRWDHFIGCHLLQGFLLLLRHDGGVDLTTTKVLRLQ